MRVAKSHERRSTAHADFTGLEDAMVPEKVLRSCFGRYDVAVFSYSSESATELNSMCVDYSMTAILSTSLRMRTVPVPSINLRCMSVSVQLEHDSPEVKIRTWKKELS